MITNTPIFYEKIETDYVGNRSLALLDGQIKGARFFHHTIQRGSTLDFKSDSKVFHILLLIGGEASFEMNGITYTISKRASFIAGLNQDFKVKANSSTQIFEIEWSMMETDYAKLDEYKTLFPLIQIYEDSTQYTDDSKTAKTINRIVLEQLNIPRFAMGSVESYGVDRVTPNSHPTIDQMFFTFPENKTELIINGETMTLGGNTLVHIPLGADHGSDVLEGDHMHYMWLDFLLEESCIEELATSHMKTGEMRSFDVE